MYPTTTSTQACLLITTLLLCFSVAAVADSEAFTLLLTPEQLAAMDDVCIVDVRPAPAFMRRHIPEAISLDARVLSEKRDGHPAMLRSPDTVAQILAKTGITRDKPVVLYGDNNTTASVALVTLVFWVLDYMAYPQVALLDGGLERWVASDNETASGASTSVASAVVAAHPLNDNLYASKETVSAAIDAENQILVDARDPRHYTGRLLQRGMPRQGHIPGAVNIPFKQLLTTPHATFNSIPALREILYPDSITPDQTIIVYCTSGSTSTIVYFAYRLLGHRHIANYDGSMIEWVMDETLPLVTGAN